MAAVFHELLGSRTVEFDAGKTVASRMFHVFDAASPLTTPDQIAALYGTTDGNGITLPAYGDVHPNLTGVVALSPRAEKVQGHSDLWLVTWQYRQLAWSPTDKQPNEVGYVDVSANGTGVVQNLWRRHTTAQLDAAFGDGGSWEYGTEVTIETDIGGTPMDSAGEPTSMALARVEVQLAETVDTLPNALYLSEFLNRRNNTNFGDVGKGVVLYTGWDIQRLDLKLWRVSHKFVLDPFRHLAQVPVRNPDGTVMLSNLGLYANQYADTVTWRQPFPNFADFNAISPNIAGVI